MADLGMDLSCVHDFDAVLSTVSGRRCLGEAIARRLITPRGRLIDDPNYGFDLTGYVNDDVTAKDLAWMQAQAEAECLKDERVTSATVTISVENPKQISVRLLAVVTLTDGAGPFQLVLAVSAVTITLLTVSV